jgi:hypothetical protein
MRPRLIALTSLIAVACFAFALKGQWGEALAPSGTLLRVSLHGILQAPQNRENAPAFRGCSYLRGRGAVELCAPAEGADAAFSMLCAAFPLVAAALVMSLMCCGFATISPYARRNTAAALSGAAFVAALAGTVLAMIAMPRALAALQGLGLQFGAPAYTAAWVGIGCLAFAAALSTASGMLGHT